MTTETTATPATNPPTAQPTVTTKTVTVQIKDHPRHMYYTGRQASDHLNALMNYMVARNPDVRDTARVQTFLKKVKVDDLVGIGHKGYKVVGVDMNKLTLDVQNAQKNNETLSTDDLEMALGMGFCEILYRNNKPYGIKTTKKVKLNIVDFSKVTQTAPTEETQPSVDPSTNSQ
jgi:hypothetical protein